MSFELEETTVSKIHAAFQHGELNAATLVTSYLQRIEAYDKQGPTLNAVITVNHKALDEAKRLDKVYAETGEFLGPLHGIPILVKDQAETKDIMTTFGSIAMDGYLPKEDATAIAKLKQAGGISLGKTT